MEFKNLLAWLVLSSLGVSSSNAVANQASHAQKPAITAETRQDADALAWVRAVNENEIALARLAKKKSTDKAVTNFADRMIVDHTKNLNMSEKLSRQLHMKMEAKGEATNMKKHGKEEMNKLKALKDKAFDKAYIDAMVEGHTKVLDTLDNTYLKDAHNPQIKSFLESTRATVAQHLTAAKEVQGELAKQAEAAPAA